jgi:hypothetical protein
MREAAYLMLHYVRSMETTGESTMRTNSIAIALIGALGVATAGHAQTDKNNPNDPARQDPLTMQGSAPEEWTQAKGNEKGYLTMQDAQPNSWLAQNFKSCDKNGDGKVTQDEYTKCEKQKTH